MTAMQKEIISLRAELQRAQSAVATVTSSSTHTIDSSALVEVRQQLLRPKISLYLPVFTYCLLISLEFRE